MSGNKDILYGNSFEVSESSKGFFLFFKGNIVKLVHMIIL
jgi:hypothetical protein